MVPGRATEVNRLGEGGRRNWAFRVLPKCSTGGIMGVDYEAIVKLLLGKGADLNALGGRKRSTSGITTWVSRLRSIKNERQEGLSEPSWIMRLLIELSR